MRRRLGCGVRWSAAAALAGCAVTGHAWADEPMFGYVNTTDLLPKGKAQVEQWVTARTGQAQGRYRRLEGRTEVDYGLADDLQVTGYLNYDHVSAEANSPQGLTQGLGVRPGHPSGERYRRGRFGGATAEVIWRLASPYLAPVGVAVLADATRGPAESTARVRGIVQKNFRDDTVIVAANLSAETGRRPASAPSALRPKVTALEFNLGASYRFRANWSAAVEYRRRAEYPEAGFGRADYVADLVGPTLHYGGQRWFFTATAMRQVHASVRAPALRAQSADGLVFGARHTRWDGLRLRLGRTF